jgi:hypothetical protein
MAGLTIDMQMLGKPKEKFWITYIRQRIKKNKNFLGFVAGQTGSGKSWSSLSICEALDKDFCIERVVFSGLELMNLINSGKLRRGSALCFEEVGVEMNSKNWASVTNKMLNYLVQTFRHQGFILIMNSPFMDFVDSATRKLFHAEMETIGIDFNAETCKLKPRLLQYNSRYQKFYYKRLKVITGKGIMPVDFWNVHKPSSALIDAYELKKKEYTESLNRRIYAELQEVQNKREKSNRKTKDLTGIQQETLDLIKQGLNVKKIALSRGRAEGVVFETIKLIKKKGYKFKPVYEAGVVKSYDVIEPMQANS